MGGRVSLNGCVGYGDGGSQKDFRGNEGRPDKVLKGECNWLSERWTRILGNSAATH